MLHILADNLFLESTVGTVVAYTEPIALGDHDSIMLEAWLVSCSGLGSSMISVYPEASNDLENWKSYAYGYGIEFFSPQAATWKSAPNGGGTIEAINFDYVRLKVTLLDSPARIVVRAGVKPVKLP